MRMNRGTIVLIAALLVVIVAVLVINRNQASAPGVTPTAVEATGALIPGVSADSIVHYEVRDNTSGFFTSLTKDSGGSWHIDGTNTLPERDPDQSLITSTAGQIVTINYANTFQNDQLADFGLTTPAYTILVNTSDGKEFTLYVGSKAPTSARYYTVLQTGSGPAATEAAAASTAEATAEMEATAETTAAAKKAVHLLQATAEATSESAATPEMMAATAEATPEVMAASTAEVTAEATANVVQNPAVTLSGNQTIYVIPQSVIDTLARWINTPPYAALPTAVPTEIAAPLSFPTLEAVAPATTQAITEATAEATQSATAEATAGS